MPIRLAARAVIVQHSRLLLVNAYPGADTDLWCAPGGGVDRDQSLADTLIREVHEETGLQVAIGLPCLVNEFHDPDHAFHQVEVFFRCTVTGGGLHAEWQDPAAVVTRRGFFSKAGMAVLRYKPDSLAEIAFSDRVGYDPLELLVR